MSRLNFELRPILIEPIEEKLTGSAGLGTLLEMFDKSGFREDFIRCLPERKGPNSSGNYRLALNQIASFLCGHDCLSDLEMFRADPLIEKLFQGESAASRTMGDFLRDFTPSNTRALAEFLAKQSHSIRGSISHFERKVVHLSQDTTFHEQAAEKMEGLAFNYKGQWGLDSQVVFDELGLCYGASLRSGNTKSGSDFDPLLSSSVLVWKDSKEKYYSADSAYCHQDVIERLLNLKVKFTITAHDGTTNWRSHLFEITDWESWKWNEEQQKKSLENGQALPKVEMGHFLWQPSWAPVLRFPIVVKRTWNEEKNEWEYYGVLTNFSLFKRTKQSVIEHHNKRGNCENFIREGKYNYDLLHFPCQKLLANEAYLLLAMVAQNILRWASLLINPKRPSFAKRFRRQFLFAPGKIIRTARKTILKVSVFFYKEVSHLRQAWQSTLHPALGSPS